MKTAGPLIFKYCDYRRYLKDMYLYKKSQNASFSYRSFSRLAGLKSSNFIKMVMDGQRALSLARAQAVAYALKLSQDEVNYFENLVLYTQAVSLADKGRYYERMVQWQKHHDVDELESRQYLYFSKWYFVALRELISFPDFKEEAAWVSRKLGIKLGKQEVENAIQNLLDLNLIERTEDGRLFPTQKNITTSPEIISTALFNFHRQMIHKAGEALEKTPAHKRDLSALTLPVSKKMYEKVKERINQFRRELHVMASEDSAPEAVYQINLQLFNLTEVPWK